LHNLPWPAFMKKKRCMIFVTTMLVAGIANASSTLQDMHIAKVSGEQPDVAVPAGWKLAYKAVHPDGAYFFEYIPEGENIDNWRSGYLFVGRAPYPEHRKKTDLNQPKAASIGDAMVSAIQKEVADACKGQGSFMPMSHRWNIFNGSRVSVSGGFCSKMGSAAPYGEGAIVSVIEGEEYLHQISFHWRPISAEQREKRMPAWGDTDENIIRYLQTIRATKLCGGKNGAAC